VKLRVKVPLLVATFAIIAVVVMSTLSVRSARTSLRNQAIEHLRDSAYAYEGAVTSYLDGATDLVLAMGGDRELLDRLPPPDPQATLRRHIDRLLASRTFEYAMVLEPTGEVAALEPRDLEQALSTWDLSFLPWVAAVTGDDSVVTSDLHISPATQNPTVVIAAPIHGPTGRIEGILAAGLNLRRFATLARVGTGADRAASYGYVTDGRGLIVAHQGNPTYVAYQTDFASIPSVAAGLRGDAGAGSWVSSIDGETKLGAYLPVEDLGWVVVYAVSERTALLPAGELQRLIRDIAAALGGTLLVIAVTWTRRVVRPLRSLTRAADAIRGGDLSQHVPVASRDEIGQLAATFDAMVAELAANDADKRLRAQRLQASILELDAFSYSVSHDLRAPLRVIDGFTRALVEDYGATLDVDANAMLGRVRAAAVRMGTLIDDLLSLSQIGRSTLRLEAVDLTALCEGIVAELAAAAPERAVTVVVEPEMRAIGDPPLLSVLLGNLIANAWKFTDKSRQQRIEIGQRPTERGATTFVRDSGAGFDMAQAARLFVAFQRLHDASDFPGNGIGLATAERIVHRHGGAIWAEGSPGHGATFSFTLTANAVIEANEGAVVPEVAGPGSSMDRQHEPTSGGGPPVGVPV